MMRVAVVCIGGSDGGWLCWGRAAAFIPVIPCASAFIAARPLLYYPAVLLDHWIVCTIHTVLLTRPSLLPSPFSFSTSPFFPFSLP